MSAETPPGHSISDPDFELQRHERGGGVGFVLLGDVDADAAGRVAEAFRSEPAGGGAVALEMEDAELTDGLAVTRMVDALRLLLERFNRVRLARAPQMLAHTLYKTGALRDGRLELIEPREEEGGAG